MNINVHIEQLILDGIDVPYRERPALQAAVESELTRLLAEGGLSSDFAGGGAMQAVRGGAVPLSKGSTPSQLGLQIAQAVYRGIGQ